MNNGGIIGIKTSTSISSASGVWDLDYQVRAKKDILWPQLNTLVYINNASQSTTIPLNTISGKTQGFLGIIWQTGFNSGSTPADVVSPGWTAINSATRSISGVWRFSLQYKILSLAELGTTITPITYTSGTNRHILLLGTDGNYPISQVSIGTVNSSGVNDPPAQTLNSTTVGRKLVLNIAQYYGYTTPVSPTFTGATPTVLSGTSDHQLRFYASPVTEVTKPIITVDAASNNYSQLASAYLVIS
jgi:hypothetical protein